MTPTALHRLRRRLQLSQAKFAALVGVAPNTVARWERGELGMRGTTSRLIQFVVAQEEQERRRGGQTRGRAKK